ncbi:MAG: hypothetical protein ACRYFA_03055 [Janthinobacterium lividum]
MINTVVYSSVFIRKAKDLKKRHLSLLQDLEKLEQSLLENPKQGVALGSGLYKIRLAVESKLGGKSSGYRVITFLITSSPDSIIVNMLTVYDKSEENTIDKKALLKLIKELF